MPDHSTYTIISEVLAPVSTIIAAALGVYIQLKSNRHKEELEAVRTEYKDFQANCIWMGFADHHMVLDGVASAGKSTFIAKIGDPTIKVPESSFSRTAGKYEHKVHLCDEYYTADGKKRKKEHRIVAHDIAGEKQTALIQHLFEQDLPPPKMVLIFVDAAQLDRSRERFTQPAHYAGYGRAELVRHKPSAVMLISKCDEATDAQLAGANELCANINERFSGYGYNTHPPLKISAATGEGFDDARALIYRTLKLSKFLARHGSQTGQEPNT